MMAEMMRQRGGAQGAGAPGAQAGPPGLGAGAGGAAAGTNDFSSPVKGAESFLAAVKSKDPNRLREAVALRSQYEADTKSHRDMFATILGDDGADAGILDELATAFNGMAVSGMNTIKSTGKRGVTVSKMEKGDEIRRTLIVRREKDGWKVQDFSGKKTLDLPSGRNTAAGGAGRNY
jgi:hypothetical protein